MKALSLLFVIGMTLTILEEPVMMTDRLGTSEDYALVPIHAYNGDLKGWGIKPSKEQLNKKRSYGIKIKKAKLWERN